ncbi:MAG: AAA family ATPase [Alphaproteobacteria bacterium]|nr:AAA family ATPase [Alphaproteobacteria bacterium]
MLTGLSIRDFVLVRALDLDLGGGFTALTGETGAGKSILLSAVGLALGDRSHQGLIRQGAEAASVAASFESATDHPVWAFLAERGVAAQPGEPLVFRRTLKRGGTARAFLNDQPVSANLLEEAGALLADIHGQHEGRGLLNQGRHRFLIDAYAKAETLLGEVSGCWTRWRCAKEARAALEARLARAASERTWLMHALDELEALDPEDGEPERLAISRATMQAGERVAEAIDAASGAMAKANVEGVFANASRAISRALALPSLTGEASGSDLAARVRSAGEALERALIEAGEARAALDTAMAACEYSPAALEASEARLFALRAAARKHDVDASQLPALRRRLRLQLDEIEQSDGALAATLEAETLARVAYLDAASRLSAAREQAGRKLARAVSRELGPLKLDKARFRVLVARREEADAGPTGLDDVAFEIETNAGAGFGALTRIASGGELARFALAISVCLAGASPCATLVFDEADVGVGGAVAAAIGERLSALARERQVLAITHSPQVAAAATHQWRIAKDDASGAAATSVDVLEPRARREEIARMLAGASITREARAAATRLLAGA